MMKYLKLRQKIKDLILENKLLIENHKLINNADNIYICSLIDEKNKLESQLKEANEKLVILTSVLPEEILKERLKP